MWKRKAKFWGVDISFHAPIFLHEQVLSSQEAEKSKKLITQRPFFSVSTYFRFLFSWLLRICSCNKIGAWKKIFAQKTLAIIKNKTRNSLPAMCFLLFFASWFSSMLYLGKNYILSPTKFELPISITSIKEKCLFDENGVTKRQFFSRKGKLEHEKILSQKKQSKKLSNLHLFKSRTLAHHWMPLRPRLGLRSPIGSVHLAFILGWLSE